LISRENHPATKRIKRTAILVRLVRSHTPVALPRAGEKMTPEDTSQYRLMCYKEYAMRLSAILVLATLLLVSPCMANDHPFDGTWETTVSCENAAGALGYSYRFDSIVKDDVLHGEKGDKGKPGWYQLDGKIANDGTARFYADGLVGASETAVGHLRAGSRYNYHVDATFSGDSGTGKRVEGRPCTLEFKRKPRHND
jgi:hypothetical protein